MHPSHVVPSRAPRPAVLRLLTLLVGALLAASTLLVAAPPAHAYESAPHTWARYDERAAMLLHVVANQKGDPYRYGAAGPGAFDCSGLVYFAFRRALGRTVPRTANDQKRAARRVYHRSNLRPGDLVFEVNSSGYAYHVGIYAGRGYFWHAPHTGSYVKKQKMYPSHWRFGRLIYK